MKTWVARMLSVVLGVAAILKLSETWLFDSSAWLTQVHFNGGPDSLRHKHFQDDDEFPAFYEPSIKTEVRFR